MGLRTYTLEYFDDDGDGIYSDSLNWVPSNPEHFTGDTTYFENWIELGFPSLESSRGTTVADPNFVKIIWEGRLGNLPPDRPSGQVIEVTFDYDLNQVMHCSFKDVSSGKLVEIDLNEKHGISSESTESKMKDNIDEFLIE